jgi:hypothetical protein
MYACLYIAEFDRLLGGRNGIVLSNWQFSSQDVAGLLGGSRREHMTHGSVERRIFMAVECPD